MNNHCQDCCAPINTSVSHCGCCEGVEVLTPLAIYNRPGLSEIDYRVGTHASFFESMQARLTGFALEKPDSEGNLKKYYPLQGLTTRDKSDASIALLDAWSTVGDVLTFYQERIANEGYLRTATERRSVLELARLVGYKPRPGVSASVFLAYNIDKNFKEETTIPIGSRAQSIPGPDELPQAFETSEEITARAQWNDLKPRLSQPQTSKSITEGSLSVSGPRVYLKGVSTNLKVNDPLLIELGSSTPDFYRVQEVIPDAIADKTLVLLDGASNFPPKSSNKRKFSYLNDLVLPPSIQPRNALRLRRKIKGQFKSNASSGYRSVASFTPKLKRLLSTAASNAIISLNSEIKVYRLDTKASLFGHNFPRRVDIPSNGGVVGDGGDWPIIEDNDGTPIIHESKERIFLNAAYDGIKQNSWMVIEKPLTRLSDNKRLIVKVGSVDASQVRAEYGASAPATNIAINYLGSVSDSWIDTVGKSASTKSSNDFNLLRAATVYAQPVELELAEEPIENPVCGGTDDLIELDGFYEGLESGRWVIVSGERDIAGTSGVRFSELAMLSEVSQDVITERASSTGVEASVPLEAPRREERTHTFIKIAEKLAYCFKRDTVVIHGNVVKATHGESRHEILGSGNGAKNFQVFELKQKPLTHVSASNPTGIDSSLKLLVNDIEWHEADSLAELKNTDRKFITKIDNEDVVSVIFGNGEKGLRLPSGSENIRAKYRSGIGKGGNVNAEQISLLMSKPLGVKEVINPLRASGGANRETADQARKHVPLAIKALDRLVSVKDYEDFSRIYAGIGKAFALEISDGRQQLVHVTIAGAEDIPIDESSDLFRNLRTALHDFGDPQQAIELAIRELLFITLEADIAILPNYQWEAVEPVVRKSLLDAFGFEKRKLGQSVMLSEVIKTMQTVQGVAYVDVNAFGGIPEKRELFEHELTEKIEEIEKINQMKVELKEEELNIRNELATVLQRQILSPDEITGVVSGINEMGVMQYVAVNFPSVITIKNDLYPLKHIRPAQIAYLTPEVPSTLILNQIVSTS